MTDHFEYTDGRCTVCHEDTKVRWKNLYVIGSEGLYTCHPCEMEIVRFIEKQMRDKHMARKKAFLEKKAKRG